MNGVFITAAPWEAPKHCPDCIDEGKKASLIFDKKQNGYVCPRCERVYSPWNPPGNLHYASKKGVQARIMKDRKRASVITAALGKRICEEN